MRVFVCLIVLPFLFGCGQSSSVDNRNPNIIIILADDLGYADVSFHDHPAEISTPAIDQLANDGVAFTNGYVTAFVCSPTRAGLLTGRYQQRFGFYTVGAAALGLPLNEILIPEILKEEGYITSAIGKWHLGDDPAFGPEHQGFDQFYGFLGRGGHDYFDFNCYEEKPFNCIIKDGMLIEEEEGYLTDILARESISFINENAENQNPFFLYLPFNAVHKPFQAPEEDIARFNVRQSTGQKNRDVLLAMLYRMDLAIGNIIQTLKETNQYNNTLIFFLSDNGGARNANNSPLKMGKHSIFEGGIRVPFVVSWPSQITPGKIAKPVISLDIFPTICSVLNIPLPQDREYDGRDLMPVINSTSDTPVHEKLFWDGNDGYWAIREGDWKLIKDSGNNFMLYNLVEDIGETENLASKYSEKVIDMKKKYQEWRSNMANPMR